MGRTFKVVEKDGEKHLIEDGTFVNIDHGKLHSSLGTLSTYGFGEQFELEKKFGGDYEVKTNRDQEGTLEKTWRGDYEFKEKTLPKEESEEENYEEDEEESDDESVAVGTKKTISTSKLSAERQDSQNHRLRIPGILSLYARIAIPIAVALGGYYVSKQFTQTGPEPRGQGYEYNYRPPQWNYETPTPYNKKPEEPQELEQTVRPKSSEQIVKPKNLEQIIKNKNVNTGGGIDYQVSLENIGTGAAVVNNNVGIEQIVKPKEEKTTSAPEESIPSEDIYKKILSGSEFLRNTPQGYFPVVKERRDANNNVTSRKTEYISVNEADQEIRDEVIIFYPKSGKTYSISKEKYPEFYKKSDLNNDGKVTLRELGKGQELFGKITIKYPEGDIESIVKEFLRRY